jgi:carbon storage regulator
MIGDEIEVSVLAVMGEKVRIGIEAPRAIPVFRKEVWIDMQSDQATEGEREVVDEALKRLSSSD